MKIEEIKEAKIKLEQEIAWYPTSIMEANFSL